MPFEGQTRLDTYNITVTIAGQNLGTWDADEGGTIDSDSSSYRPGGMADPVSLGGTKTVEDVTLRRLYRLGRDHHISQRYIDWAGHAFVNISKQPLDIHGNKWGKPLVWNGILKSVKFPSHDSQSSEAGLIEIVVTIEGFPTGMDI